MTNYSTPSPVDSVLKKYHEFFAMAIREGYEERLIQEFRDHLDLRLVAHQRNFKGQSLLNIAAGFGDISMAKDLIMRGADVNSQDSEGVAPLHNSCNHNHTNSTKYLLKKGADVNKIDHEGWTPLHWVLGKEENRDRINPRWLKMVDVLLDNGANPTIKTLRHGRDCMTLIRNHDDKRYIKFKFLSKGVLERQDDFEAMQAFIDKHLTVNEYFEIIKIGDENLDLIKVFTTKRLLQSRLREYGGITPLHRAAGYNHLTTAQFLVESGASVSASDDFGRIPLHNAAEYGHVDMIELLVDKGSYVNAQDASGLSPLHLAACLKPTQTFTPCLKLVELGANVNSTDNNGLTPVEHAQSDIVKQVLKSNFPRTELILIPSSSDQHGIYMHTVPDTPRAVSPIRSELDDLMLDSSSPDRLFRNDSYRIKTIKLLPEDIKYQKVMRKMQETLMFHENDMRYNSYEILSIHLLLNEPVWSKYRLICQKLEIEYGPGSKNEKLLFHGSNFIESIQKKGFDERFAQRDGMFGAGIYFAQHSSKSTQYTFGPTQLCPRHRDKSCYICERHLIFAQVALGKTLVSKQAMPECAHAPPGYSSVSGLPGITLDLKFPEYVIYNGDQAYPLYLIQYRIKQVI